MKSTPFLAELKDAGLTARAYNLGLKLVPNLPHVVTLETLEYYEEHLAELKDVLKAGFERSITDVQFYLIKAFELFVPKDYNHATQLDSFKERNREKFCFYNKNITDQNFSRVSHQLVPGKTYKVKLFGIKKGETVSSQDCLDVYRVNLAYCMGAQGVSLVWEHAKEELIKGKWYCSFDEKDNLPFVDGYLSVPNVGARSAGGDSFGLGSFEGVWYDVNVLVLFCDCDESA